jgi:hypothetical protein
VWGATKLNEVMWMLGVIQNPSLEEARFIAFLPADKELRGMTKKLGFKQEGRLKNASLAGDLLVLGQYR